MATTGYAAGISSGATSLAYAPESVWGTLPTAGFRKLRFTSESLAGSEELTRPNEIDGNRSVSAQVRTSESAGGTVNFAASFGTFDDLIAAVLGGDWALNVVMDGDVFQSFTLEKRLTASLYYRYSGAFPNSLSLNVSQGQFTGGSIGFIAKEETTSATPLDSVIDPASTGDVFNSTTGITNILLGGVSVGKLMSIGLRFTNEGATADRVLGTGTAAGGINPGILMAGSDFEAYFANADLFNRWKAETKGAFTFRIQDPAGKGYNIELLRTRIQAQSPSIQDKLRPLMIRGTIMAEPDTTAGATLGKTVRITRDAP